MRVVMVTFGSWGDLFPFLGVGRALADSGHDVVVAGTPSFEDFVVSAGLEFAGIGRPVGLDDYAAHPEILSNRFGGFAGFRSALDLFVFSQLDELVDELAAAAVDADVLVTHPAHPAGPIVAEMTDVPLVTASVFPSMIETAFHPPGVRVVPRLPGVLDHLANASAWSVARRVFRRAFDPPVNEARVRVGLPPVRDVLFGTVRRSQAVLVLASPLVVPRPPDWLQHVQLTGFVQWDQPQGWRVDTNVEAFLAEGPAPVLITLGSSGALEPGDFFARAVSAARSAGRRALVISGPTASPEFDGDDVCITTVAPYSEVIPRCAVVLHHGGIGTAVSCWHAGIPQVVVPRSFDQPVTASLVSQLGHGRSIAWDKATTARLTAALRETVADEDVARRTRQLATLLAEEDGAGAAAHALQSIG